MSLYVVAYDIADPGRLRRVARVMERHAVRCQKSVFLYRGDEARVGRLLDEAARHLAAEEDVIQAWRLAGGQENGGHTRGTPLPCRPAAAVCEAGGPMLVPRAD